MNKIVGALFGLLCFIVLVGPLALWGSDKAGVPLPESLTAGSARYLTGTYAEDADIRGNMSIGGFASKQLQDQLEIAVENYVPAKASVLLFNAGMERTCIQAANVLCGWPCYPTRFESKVLYIPEHDVLGRTPCAFDDNVKQRLSDTAQDIARLSRDYPEKRFVLYLVGGLENPAVSPAYDLVTEGMSPEAVADYLNEMLSDLGNVSILYDSYDDLDSYYHDFFLTDHHWKITGAETAYNTIATTLGLPGFSAGLRTIDNYRFSGSTARDGLYPMTEDVFDIDYDFSFLEERDKWGEFVGHFNHDKFWAAYDSGDPAIVSMYHDLYYDANYINGGYAVGGDGDRDAMLISNSYGGDIRPLLAMHYSSLRYSIAFSMKEESGVSLREMIEESDPDDIIFVAHPSAYAGSLPSWFLAT